MYLRTDMNYIVVHIFEYVLFTHIRKVLKYKGKYLKCLACLTNE